MLRNILSEAQNVGDQGFNRRKMLKLLLELGESFEWDDSEWYKWFSPGLPTAPMLAQILGDQAELDNDLARCCWYYLLWICGVARGDGVNVALWRHGVRIREGILVVNAERLPLFETVQEFRILKDPEDWDERERGFAVVSIGGHDSFQGRKDLIGVIEIHHQGQVYLELECMWRAPLFGDVGAADHVAGAASTQPEAAVPGSPGPFFVD